MFSALFRRHSKQSQSASKTLSGTVMILYFCENLREFLLALLRISFEITVNRRIAFRNFFIHAFLQSGDQKQKKIY